MSENFAGVSFVSRTFSVFMGASCKVVSMETLPVRPDEKTTRQPAVREGR